VPDFAALNPGYDRYASSAHGTFFAKACVEIDTRKVAAFVAETISGRTTSPTGQQAGQSP
jgi:hypothetical protein